MTTEARVVKDRSPNFPFIPLATALKRAEEFYAKEKRGSAPFQIAADHWRLSPKSSGALQTAAALKSYGLMSDEGSGQARKVRLTDLALRVILDSRPDSTEKQRYIQQAARTPAVAAEIYKLWPDELPSPANLHHFLVLERKFNDSTAHKVVKIVQQNHTFAALDSSVPAVDISESSNEETQDDSISGVDTQAQMTMSKLASPVSSSAAAPPLGSSTERIFVGDAVLTIQFTGQPSAEVFEFLEKYGAFRKKVLKGE